jgi:ribosome-associated toxin RatA of RatAB toxin-antitoxin module
MVHASPEAIYGVVTDFEHYVDWVSDLKRIEVVTVDDQGRGLEVEFRAAAFGRSTTYTLHYDYAKAPNELSWRQIQGDLTETLNGRYKFETADDETKVTYDLEVELLVPIPTFIKSRAAYRIQTQALRELKAQAEQSR